MDEDKLSKKSNSLHEFQNNDVSYSKLMESGIELPSHISNRLPDEFIVIECIKTEFFEAIQCLQKHDVFGVSLEGSNIGRSGTLAWLTISSSMCTYLFNIKTIGKAAFDNGLKMLMENKRIVKVFHDCRRAADCFYHQYNTKPSNVYDTQVADFVANAIKKDIKLITNEVNSLNKCLKLYLNVQNDHLCEQFNITEEAFSSLSLNHSLLKFFIKNVIYLRILKQELDMILRMPFRRCVDVYLNVLLRKSDQELKLYNYELECVPPELVLENMQLFKFSENLKPQDSTKRKNEDDPFSRYERDCKKYQQKYGYGKFADNKEPETDRIYENVDVGWSSSGREEIIQFLLDRMFACDSSDRSVISMTPFENLSEHDDCSVASERNICDMKIDTSIKSSRNNPIVPNNNFEYHPYLRVSSSLKPLQNQNESPDFPNVTLPNVDSCTNFKTVEPTSSASSLSSNSQVSKTYAEQNCILNNNKEFLSNSFKDKHFANDLNLSSSKNNLNGGATSAFSNFSSEAEEIFSEKKHLLASQRHMLRESISSDKNSMKYAASFNDRDNFNEVKGSDNSNSSNSSLSGKFKIYRIFAEQKHSLANEHLKSSDNSKGDADVQCVDLNSHSSNKNSVSDQSLIKENDFLGHSPSHKNLSLNSRLKKLLESMKQAKSDCSSGSSSSTDSNELLKETSLNSCADQELSCFQHESQSHSMNNFSIYSKPADLCDQDSDPWARLRDAFAELGPVKYGSEKVVFVPAGMQY